MRMMRTLFLLVLCLGLTHFAHAEVLPTVTCVNDGFSGGLWYYDFTLTNPQDSTVAGIQSLRFVTGYGDFSPIDGTSAGWTPGLQPDTWLLVDGTDEQLWYANAFVNNVKPGASLTGFRLSSDHNLTGDLSWRMETEEGLGYCEGTVSLGQADAGVPEPCSLLLLGLAAGPAVAWRRKSKRANA